MSPEVILFTVIALSIGFSALAVVFNRNIVRAAVWLLFTLIGVSVLYFLLGAEFLGASQLIVYVGGTLVLVIFGVMLTAHETFVNLRSRPAEVLLASILGLALFGLLVQTSIRIGTPAPTAATADAETPTVSVGEIGLAFMNVREVQAPAMLTSTPGATIPRQPMGFLLPFEIVSVHLLVVLVGAAYLARAKKRVRGRAENPHE